MTESVVLGNGLARLFRPRRSGYRRLRRAHTQRPRITVMREPIWVYLPTPTRCALSPSKHGLLNFLFLSDNQLEQSGRRVVVALIGCFFMCPSLEVCPTLLPASKLSSLFSNPSTNGDPKKQRHSMQPFWKDHHKKGSIVVKAVGPLSHGPCPSPAAASVT